MDFKKKANSNFFNDKLLFKTLGVVFLIIIVVFAVADFRIYQKKIQLTAEITAYKKQIADIEKSSQTLKDEIANSDNKDYLEKLGYEQFDETKPGETEYMFVESAQKAQTTPVQQNNSWTGWLTGLWQWIKSKI